MWCLDNYIDSSLDGYTDGLLVGWVGKGIKVHIYMYR